MFCIGRITYQNLVTANSNKLKLYQIEKCENPQIFYLPVVAAGEEVLLPAKGGKIQEIPPLFKKFTFVQKIKVTGPVEI